MILLLLLPLVATQTSNEIPGGNPFPGEIWNTDFIDVGGNLLFYYLFRCRKSELRHKNLLLYLQGGPGYSTAFSVFAEGGPYTVNNVTEKIERNPYAWNEIADTLFIDQPAPTNFSISKDPAKKCRNQTCAARDLHTFLLHFLEIYPEYKGVPLYIGGVSYGGHYVPYLAHYLMETESKDFNVKGIAIGNGLIDEYTQLWSFPYTLRKAGLIDFFTYALFESQTIACRIAYELGVKSMEINCTQAIFSIYNNIGLKNDPYDLKEHNSYGPFERGINAYLSQPDVQAALGVNGSLILQNSEVYEIMKPDFTLDLTGYIAKLLKKGVKTYIYFGVDDYICNVYGGEDAVNKIPWENIDKYLKEKEEDWVIKGVKYGTYKEYDKLRFIKVHGAGHTIFFKQKYFGLEMFKTLIGINTPD